MDATNISNKAIELQKIGINAVNVLTFEMIL